jgi:integrase
MEHVKLTTPYIKTITDKEGTRVADTIERNLQVWVGKTSVTFYLVMKHEGRQRNISLGRFPTMQADEARELAKKKIAEVLNHTIISPSEGRMVTLGTAIDEYIEMKSSVANQKATRCVLNRFALLRNVKLSMLRHEDIVRIHNDLKDIPTTANRAVKYVCSAISYAIRKHNLNIDNVAMGIKLYAEKPRERYMKRDEGVLFYEKAEQLSKTGIWGVQTCALLMMLYTGARKSNVLQMRFDEIDENGTWTIPKEKFKGGRKEHKVELGERELKMVERMRKIPHTTGYVFEYRGHYLSDVRKTKNAICKLAGISDLHVHDLRRTLGTWMLSQGVPIGVVSKKLGHSSIRITEQVYAHVLPDVSRHETDRTLDEMLGDTEKQ